MTNIYLNIDCEIEDEKFIGVALFVVIINNVVFLGRQFK